MKNPLLAGVTGLFLTASAQFSYAADDPLTIVVTASRSAETVDETMVPVTVISREDIDKSGAVSVPDILATVPGVSIARNGGRGQSTSLFLRGVESDQTLVLIDGVKVGSATLGTTPFQDLPLDQVEKIEVVRGPRSSLYGSEAIGGVIQIFTRKGGQGTRPVFSVSGGSHNTSDVNLGVSGGGEKTWYSIQAAHFQTDGFDACRASFDGGCFVDEPDDDGYENTSVTLRGGATLTDTFSLEGGILNVDSDTEFDGSFQNSSENLTRVSHLKATLAATDNWTSSLLVAESKDKADNFLDDVFASRFDTTRDQVSFQNDIQLGANQIIAGIDYIDDEIDSDSVFDQTSRDNTGIFASWNSRFGYNDIELSLRGDDNEQFGSETTGGIAYGRELGGDTRLTMSYGTAFKAPTFNELYFPDFGNPDLGAETSESIDVGLSGRIRSAVWAINLYRTEVDDLIAFDLATSQPVNIGQAEITGLEFSGAVDLGEWRLSGNLTLQDPKDSSGGENDGNQLARRPEQMANLGIDRDFDRFNVGGKMRYGGKRFNDLENQEQLDSFTLVDLYGEYQFTPRWAIGVKVNNVFDEEYETARFYNQDGINALATLRYIPR